MDVGRGWEECVWVYDADGGVDAMQMRCTDHQQERGAQAWKGRMGKHCVLEMRDRKNPALNHQDTEATPCYDPIVQYIIQQPYSKPSSYRLGPKAHDRLSAYPEINTSLLRNLPSPW